MEDLKDVYKDLPQLIVALDSLDEDANYIHIKDAKENTVYYCPCCKGIIKPRAYKDDKEYQVQAHYYHETGGCSDETFVHFICKTWLFESGCKFQIKDQIYTVKKIETEKTYHTSFGDYRPDITIYTEENKVFFFEIKNTNKKTELYMPKWDELENDVVEVDVRYFINQKLDSSIPSFNLIYSNGECFIKKYTRNEYEETIARRKLEWKRQDKLNYKMMWEKLDWFWIELQRYKNGESNDENILKSFSSLNFYDIEDCWNIISKMSCFKNIRNEFRDIVNSKSKEKSNELLQDIIKEFEGKLEHFDVRCEPKSDLKLYFDLTEYYRFSQYGHTECLIHENKAWIVHPSKVIELFNDFKERKANLIINHCNNIDKIKTALTWNNAPMLFDKYVFGKYMNIDYTRFNGYNTYVEDAEKIINETNIKIIDEVSNFYINNNCMSKTDVRNFINNSLSDFKLIYKLLDSQTYGDEYAVFYKGNKVMSFVITNEKIIYKDNEFNYNFVKKHAIKCFIKECVDTCVEEFKNCIPVIDMISDIKRYSNDTWEFGVNIDNKSIVITLNYIVPYYDLYTKRVTTNKEVDILDMFNENFHFVDYHKDVNDFLNKRIAPAMEELINAVICEYNLNHLNSALCKTSDIKKLTKEECECQNN